MKKRYLIILFLLFIFINVKAESCVSGLNVRGSTYRVNGHQNMWLPNGNFTYKGSLPPASCFNISKSDIVSVRVNGSNFQFQPHKFGNASITVSVDSSCLCSGTPSLSKTINFKLSEWGLKRLSVKGYQISPKFYNGTFDYTLQVPYNTSEIEIVAEPNYPTSIIKGDGKRKLNVGKNKLVINVTTKEGDSRDYTINVTREEPVNPTSIKINESDLNIYVGTKEKLTYAVTPKNAKTNIKWESSYPSVIAVVDGSITALKSGTSTITIRDGNLSDSINITAVDKIYDIKTDDKIILFKNEHQSINYEILPDNAINKEVIFTSSDETLFKVTDDGIINTFDKTGTGILTITSKESGFKKKIQVTVKAKLENIFFNTNEVSLKVNETKKLNINIEPDDVDVEITYTSNNPNIVSVNNIGVIKGISEGSTTITASTLDKEFNASITINVIKEDTTLPIDNEDHNNNEKILIVLIIIVSLILVITLLSIKKNKSK
ncbi:MAG: Ig-like domain-containing protein [Bacilli bacterium]|nr:Ig-like domain-containing protein [Bacilli bacterium]